LPPDTPNGHAVSHVTFDDAVWYAEAAGKRLMDEVEYEYAATNKGNTKYPWGDAKQFPPWRFGQVREPGFDRTSARLSEVPVSGLYSTVAELVTSRPHPYPGSPAAKLLEKFPSPQSRKVNRSARVIRGGPFALLHGAISPAAPMDGPQW